MLWFDTLTVILWLDATLTQKILNYYKASLFSFYFGMLPPFEQIFTDFTETSVEKFWCESKNWTTILYGENNIKLLFSYFTYWYNFRLKKSTSSESFPYEILNCTVDAFKLESKNLVVAPASKCKDINGFVKFLSSKDLFTDMQ